MWRGRKTHLHFIGKYGQHVLFPESSRHTGSATLRQWQ